MCVFTKLITFLIYYFSQQVLLNYPKERVDEAMRFESDLYCCAADVDSLRRISGLSFTLRARTDPEELMTNRVQIPLMAKSFY